MQVASQDDWVSSKVIVSRIYGEDVKDNSHRYFKEKIASKPDFPRAADFGGTKVWNWGEISDHLKKERDSQKAGRPRVNG